MNNKIIKQYLIDVYEHLLELNFNDDNDNDVENSINEVLDELKNEDIIWDFSQISLDNIMESLNLPKELKFSNWKIKRRQYIINNIKEK